VAVVNGASFRGEQPVTAGSWAAAFPLPAGRAFAGIGAAATAGGFPLPKTLGGVTVRIDGLEAPLYDVRPSQVTFLIPGAVQPGLRPVQIAAAGGATITGTVRVISSAPGLFIKDTAVPPRAAVRNQDGTTENNASSPALRGEVISLYGTGPGALSTAVEDGAPPGFRPLATTRSAPQVFIGGVEATVQFSGLNPDVPGLWQINVVVPPLAFLSGRVPVRVFVDGVDSNEVAIFVQ
jgi:uncharacterized protein (TIGR03437 family)